MLHDWYCCAYNWTKLIQCIGSDSAWTSDIHSWHGRRCPAYPSPGSHRLVSVDSVFSGTKLHQCWTLCDILGWHLGNWKHSRQVRISSLKLITVRKYIIISHSFFILQFYTSFWVVALLIIASILFLVFCMNCTCLFHNCFQLQYNAHVHIFNQLETICGSCSCIHQFAQNRRHCTFSGSSARKVTIFRVI